MMPRGYEGFITKAIIVDSIRNRTKSLKCNKNEMIHI